MSDSNDDKTKKPETANVKSDYDVGYRKPPVNTRFKPGQSGNPKGRTKGTRSSAAVFLRHLNRKVKIPIGDKTETITIGELIDMNLINKAAKASIPHIKLVKELAQGYGLTQPITNINITFVDPPIWPPDPD